MAKADEIPHLKGQVWAGRVRTTLSETPRCAVTVTRGKATAHVWRICFVVGSGFGWHEASFEEQAAIFREWGVSLYEGRK